MPTDASLILTSPAHVKWVMELIGHGLSLPIEDVNIVNGCMAVYSSWLLDATTKPIAVKQAAGTCIEQRFWQTIYMHISLLFEPRKHYDSHVWSTAKNDDTTDLIDTHVELCRTALKLVLSSVRILGREFEEGTWGVVLRERREGGGSWNEREEGEDPGPRMGDALCEDLIRVLMEVWLRSETQDSEMWDCLNKRVFCQFTVEAELHVIGDVNAIESPQNFEVAILGLARIVDAFHFIGSNNSNVDSFGTKTSPPDGNTILHMFGDWLFKAILRPSLKYEEGISQAYAIICRIFSKPQRRQPFDRPHLDRFYNALKVGLKSDSQSLTSIIMNSENLFSLDLEGIRLLIPNMVIALRRVLPKLERDFILNYPVDELRRAAFRIIGCVMTVPNHFDGVMVEGLGETDRQSLTNPDLLNEDSILLKRILTYYHRFDASRHFDSVNTPAFYVLKPRLLEMLISSLKVETSPTNCKMIINLLCCFAFEEARFCPGVPVLVIGAIKEKIGVRSVWAGEVIMCALETLAQLTALWKYVNHGNKTCARELVISLCQYIDGLFVEDSLVANHTLIIKAYDCLIRWCIIGTWILGDRDCLTSAISSLCRGITLLDREGDFSAISSTLPTTPISNTGSSLSIGSDKTPLSVSNATSTLATHFANLAETVKSGTSERRKLGVRSNTKIFQKLPHVKVVVEKGGGVSTETKDGGVGLPTFATLKCELAVKSAAETAFAHLVNQLGHFPPFGESTGVSRVSTVWSELEELKRILEIRGKLRGEPSAFSISELRRFLRYYIFDGRVVVGLLEHPNWAYEEEDGETVDPRLTIILRDATGKYSWTTKLKYIEDTGRIENQWHSNRPSPSATNSNLAAVDNSTKSIDSIPRKRPSSAPARSVLTPSRDPFPDARFTASIIPTLAPHIPPSSSVVHVKSENDTTLPQLNVGDESMENRRSFDVIKKLMEKQFLWEDIKISTTELPPLELDRGSIDTPSSVFRLYLAQNGFLNLEHREKLRPLSVSDTFLKDLEKLDSLPERECVPITVLFARSCEDTVDNIIQPSSLSQDFYQFLYTIAWPVDSAKHTGFSGSLNPSACSTLPYFSSSSTEVIFQTPYLLSIQDPITRKNKALP
ncbi:hypothetical protein BC829DRAFT_446414 [Chytridium lagenaria]|nr:hypothetical protein BC829DRAFT_446414 [Chytridium lagenaria]